MLDIIQWKGFLTAWSTEILGLLAQIGPEHRDALMTQSLENGTLMREPATANAISEAESRIGRGLPESYKRFLLASNGFLVHGLDAQDGWLRPVECIGWLHAHEPDLVSAWSRSEYHVPDDLYFNYGPDQDPVHLRTEYMASTLQVSDFVDSVVILLNPEVADEHGEWEGWDFGNAYPGAYRYRSFEGLMMGLRARTVANIRQTIAFLPMLAARRT
jgi:hypothetical protein